MHGSKDQVLQYLELQTLASIFLGALEEERHLKEELTCSCSAAIKATSSPEVYSLVENLEGR